MVPDCYSVSFLISQSPSLITSFFFYTLFPFHFCPPRAGQMVGIDTCPISIFLKSLCSSCKVENHCSGITCTLMRPTMHISANRISWNIPSDDIPPLWTSTLVSREGIHPRPNLLGHYDQNQLLHLLTWAPLTMFTPPRMTSYPRLGPQA